MKYIENKNLTALKINGQYYKIFVNLDKNKLSELTKFLEGNPKDSRNIYFEKQFESAFSSFQTFLCGQK